MEQGELFNSESRTQKPIFYPNFLTNKRVNSRSVSWLTTTRAAGNMIANPEV